MPSWLLVIPVLSILVFVHELGHFLTAKRFGIKVTEFGFGFPPRLWGISIGETLYSINLIPLGGFVKMVGEEDPTEPRSFARQSILKRSIVLTAGSFMNLLLPLFIFAIILSLPHDTLVGTVTVSGVAPNSPAEESGLQEGDAILEINSLRISNHMELVKEISTKQGTEVELLIRKDNSRLGLLGSPEFATSKYIRLTPRETSPSYRVVEIVSESTKEISLSDAKQYNPSLEIGDVLRQGSIGVLIGTANSKVVKDQLPLHEAIPTAFSKIGEVISFSAQGIGSLVSSGQNPGLTGPIGIAQVTGEVAKVGIAPIFELTALISISLGIVNLLPIPALDGGRLMFVLIEGIRGGKKVSPEKEGIIHMAGFILLIGLVVVMSYFDIIRILSGNSFFR
ncbi:MAG: M50 family metallopeptidase [SAR202 cluster bacterium]|nr:M50 family metallopeptidase [SAR202 cluster bacterium]HJO60379.1 M50 family metallopeptidase [SAR202 cluster bacterium]|tara:strand:+ start:415 stop:1599 length:1185 start_codon:yes stop_codon:yes gene_type:complete